MKKFALSFAAAASALLGGGMTRSEAQPPSIHPEFAQITERFFAAIRQNNASDYRAVADGVEISYSDADDDKLSLDRARQQFPDCELVGATDTQDLGNSAYSFNGTVICAAGDKRTQTVGIIADRARVYMVRPGGFELHQESGAEKAKAEADGQRELDWLASHPLQVPSGPFKSWSKQDRQTFPAIMRNTCAYIWTMAHDASGRILPAEVSSKDEWTLGVDLCVVGHMPVDWPDRALRLQAARAALQRAAAAGSVLQIPATIKP